MTDSLADRDRRARPRWAGPGAALAGLTAVTLLAGGGAASAAVHPASTPGTISTVAGGLGGPGVASQIAMSQADDVLYTGGSLYVSDNALRQIDPATDDMSTVAGDGATAYSGNGGPATQASLNADAVAAAPGGNLVVFDSATYRVRVVAKQTGTFYGQAMTAGDIYSIAGNGQEGQTSLGGLATKTKLDTGGVAVDAAGNVVLGDGDQVVVIANQSGTYYGKAMTAGHVYRIAGTGVYGYSGNTSLATKAEVDLPLGVVVDSAGNVVFADSDNNRIRVIAAATGTSYGQAMTAGHIYNIAGNGTTDRGNGGLATKSGLQVPEGLAVDSAGNILLVDSQHFTVQVIAAATGTFYRQSMTAGHIYLLAGAGGEHAAGPFGGSATAASLGNPTGVTVDGHGNVVISDWVAGSSPGGNPVMVVAESSGTFYGQAMTAGDIYSVAGTGGLESGFGGPATRAVLPIAEDNEVTTDAAGNILFTDETGNRVLVLAQHTGTFYGQAMTSGDLYSIAGDGGFGFSGDGGPATAAEMAGDLGVVVDSHGNVLIADSGNARVRVVAASSGTFYGQAMTAGDIYSIAGDGTWGFSGDGGPATSAELFQPSAVATDGHGNVLIADSANTRVRVVAASSGTFYGQAMTAGDIYTVAGTGTIGYSGDGGPATSAEFSGMKGLTVDGQGNLVIADSGNERIRVVAASSGTFYGQAMTAGDVYTVAGSGKKGYSGNGGPATSAAFDDPVGVSVDSHGNLLIADAANDRIRVVAESSGTFYGVTMTAGDVYSVAGTGTNGFLGDGGPATSAQLSAPTGVTVDPAGDLVIADGSGRLRQVTG